MTRARASRIGVVAVLALALLALASAPVSAANRRISISNYQWSDPNISIDKGEHVSWYWIGPDTMHSITGNSANSIQWDSDAGNNTPHHAIGDEFQLTFEQPGTYSFHCKLHSTVKGKVTVTNTPGDPTAEPDPVPKSAVDLKPPNIGTPVLQSYAFGKNGTSLRYELNEKARLSADFYELRPGKKPHYVGYSTWNQGYVGFNNLRFGKAGKHFKAKPGKYLARITGTDTSQNSTREVPVKFKIFPR